MSSYNYSIQYVISKRLSQHRERRSHTQGIVTPPLCSSTGLSKGGIRLSLLDIDGFRRSSDNRTCVWVRGEMITTLNGWQKQQETSKAHTTTG